VVKSHSVWQQNLAQTKGVGELVEMETLEKYADLVLQTGVNLQKNQPLVINAPIEGAYFVRVMAKQAYELGAKEVHINWEDDELTYLKYMHAAEEVFQTYPS